jgi:hypothetical protein
MLCRAVAAVTGINIRNAERSIQAYYGRGELLYRNEKGCGIIYRLPAFMLPII